MSCNIKQILIFLSLVYFTSIRVTCELNSGDCLAKQVLEFFFSPHTLDLSKPFDAAKCSASCGNLSLPFAALDAKKRCFCGFEFDKSDIEAIEKRDSKHCENNAEEFVRLFLTQYTNHFPGITLKLSTERALLDETISIEIGNEKASETQYSVDFDDGLLPTAWSRETRFSAEYKMPGIHRIKLYVNQVQKNGNKTAVFGYKVDIIEKIHESDVTFTCSELIEPNEDANCNAVLYAGQDLIGRIDFDDGNYGENFEISRVKSRRIGPVIPREWPLARKTDDETNVILTDMIGALRKPVSIRAIEGFGQLNGDMELVIYRPFCGNETETCETEERDTKCVPGKAKECKSLFPHYKRVRRVRLTVKRGYFFIRLMRPRIVKPTDIIAFETYGGILATKVAERDEIPDMALDLEQSEEKNLWKYIDSEQITFKNDKKYFIALYMNEESSLSFPHSYSENKVYAAKFMIASKWAESNFTLQQSVNVERSIGKLKLRVVPANAVIGHKVDVMLQMNGGSNVELFWDFGDGKTEEEVIDVINPSEKLIKSHVYTEPGSYRISVNAQNVRSIVNATYGLIAEYPVVDYWELSSSSPQLLPGLVTFVLSYPFSDLPLPTNATAYILFGDGSTYRWQIPEKEFPGRKHSFEHEYRHSGKYRVTATLSNIVSSVSLKTEVYLQRKIDGFRVNFGMRDKRRKELISGYGPNADRYPVNKKITFNFDVETGDVHKYIIYLNGQLLKETTDNRFVYKNDQEGWHNFSFTAFNDIQNETSPITAQIYLMRPVSGLHASEINIDLTQPAFKQFLIEFDEPGTETCLVIDYGEHANSSIEAYGDLTACQQIFSENKFKYSGELMNPLNVSHVYMEPNDYTVRIKAGNHLPSVLSTTVSITVIEIDCRPPLVEIKNTVSDHHNASEIWRSKPVQLYAKSVVDCNASAIVTKMWRGFRVDPETDQVLEEIDLSMLDSYRKTFLYIPPFFLQKGFYKMQFVVNISSTTNHPLLPMFGAADTIIKVVPSPIIGQMSEGSQSRIIRGWGQRITLAPGNFSIDPDDYSNKNFNVTWFCRRVPGEKLDRDIPDSEQLISTPIYDRSKCSPSDPDLGGCFGKGPGIINETSRFVDWNTTVFFKPGVTYEIIVRLDPPDREPSWAGIQLVLMERSPPSITVRCQTELLCYPNVPIGQKINPVRTGLIGICSEDCDGELTFEWTIYGVDSQGNEILLPEAKDFVVGANDQKMALGKEFFDEYYPKYGDFFARLAVVNEEGDRGESDIFLHINQPPEGGECQLVESGQLALIDKIEISCSGWYDPEGKPIEYYAFWIRNLNTGVLSYLMYGPDKEVVLILPLGNFTIGVDIKDKEGSLKRLNLTDFTTEAPTKQQYDAFMSSKQLESADTEGDQSKMNMISQAISSLMSVALIDEEAEEIQSIETTTTAIPEHNATKAKKTEKELEEEAKTRAKMVKSVDSIMNVDTLNSLEQIGSVLTAISGKGKGVDNEAKDVIIKLLNKTVNLASSIQVESPQQLLDFCMYAVGTMGGIVNRMTEQIVSGVVLPTDRAKAWDLEYSVEAPEFGEEQDYIFDGKSSMDEALSKAVIEHERKNAEAQIKQMIRLTIDLVLAMLKNIVVGEKPLEFSAPSGLSLTISMFNGGGLSNKSIEHGDAIYIFPEVCSILTHKDPCFGNETLGVMAVSWPAILESYGNSVDLLSTNTKTLQLMLLDEELNIIDVSDTSEMFSIIVPRKTSEEGDESGESLPEANYVKPKMKWYENMVYHQFRVEKADSAVNIEISPIDSKSDLLLFINHRFKPMINHYEISIPLRAMSDRLINGTYDLFLGNNVIRNRTGFFYLGVVQVNSSELLTSSEAYLLDEMIINENASSVNYTFVDSNYTMPGLMRNFTTDYTLRIFTSGCYFYNYKTGVWSGEGCYVQSANKELTHCKCNHLTSFGSGFFVMPNTVDFTYVFAHAGFADNVTIYMTIVITLTAYVLLLIWARKHDRKDLESLGATPLADNDPKDKYLYEITVYTGDKEGAGTDSVVSFILSGDDDETDVRQFSDSQRKIFRRGGQDSFVMAVPRRLGRLNYCRIWHDNSGKGKFRSWYLSFIVVRDVQTSEKFQFICNRWLAVEKGDGTIDRLLPVAGREEATQFGHLFQQTKQRNLKDGHLWFSIFMRPPRSRFTRVQRVSCCAALLYLSMLVNAMWYERVPPKPKSSALEIGPFALSPEQIGVGFFSNLIVFPPTFIIVLLFRKSRLRKLRPSRIAEALKKQGVELRTNDHQDDSNKSSSAANLVGVYESGKAKSRKPLMKKKRKFMFPWWCRYIAWTLCVLSILVSIFFLWAYGIQFGDEKTRKWLTSLIISFFSSILITQPMKVLLMAMILSTVFKAPDAEIDEFEEDEEELNLELAPDEEWLHSLASLNIAKRSKRSKLYRPPNLTALEKAKLERLKEMKMVEVLKDIWSYLLFLWILVVLSYGNRDPNAHLMKDTIQSAFIDGSNSGVAFTSIKTSKDLWHWINATLIHELRIGRWYNGYQAYGLRGFLNDKVNRMMGYAVLRQVRVKEETCTINNLMGQVLSPEITKCRSYSNVIYEDRKSYGKSWTKLSLTSSEGVITKLPGDESITLVNPSRSKKSEWEYRRSSELDGLPFWGKLDVYSGGGYVMPLKGSQKELNKRLKNLQEQLWIDARTRAVFAEFSVYNPQVNLFAVITIVGEFQPGGGVIPNYRIDVVRLIHHHAGFGLFVILCELAFVAFIIYFTIREIRNMRRERRAYFQSYWNWAEVFVIGFAYAAIFFYFYRLILTHRILKIFDATHGNAYIKLQFVAQIDEIFGYIIAFTIFIGILKFIRLLRFNKRMGILYSTLHQCSKDLKSFCIVFLVVFFAFVQMFHLLFGLLLQDFSSLVAAAETTFGMVTGKFDFDAMCLASPLLGPLGFFMFILIAQIILVNIFLTLIISAFETVKHDISKQSNEFEVVAFMTRKAKELLGIDSSNNRDQLNAAMERQEGISSIEEQVNCFPEKVDRLLHYINDIYFSGELKVDSFVDPRKKRRSDMSLVSSRQRSPLSFARVSPLHEDTTNNESRAKNALHPHYARLNKRRAMAAKNQRPKLETSDSISSYSSTRRTNATSNAQESNQFVFDWMEIPDDHNL
ncbi:polycystic kidney disease protein 1-like protein 2-like protein [Dinothrombium tinctorium]|uniref:Polycystic kidney disease protein 1-like protein 2-like protein n=1 Tax=Dinothrombium tinctorium TaxID=1965070 RepID=A0A443RHN2_9ACAR|nr:polycystic kidney disease protein 1-like protein 2-like protein [Dinothrombium tinctorium]